MTSKPNKFLKIAQCTIFIAIFFINAHQHKQWGSLISHIWISNIVSETRASRWQIGASRRAIAAVRKGLSGMLMIYTIMCIRFLPDATLFIFCVVKENMTLWVEDHINRCWDLHGEPGEPAPAPDQINFRFSLDPAHPSERIRNHWIFPVTR